MSDISPFYRDHYSWMTPAQFECLELLSDLFGGLHHVYGKITGPRPDTININAENCRNHFATFDYSWLTVATVLAHDRMIRFGIAPSSGGKLCLTFQKRSTREGDASSMHPSLEDAIAKVRERFSKEAA